jgi:hypothetical protein
VKQRKQMRGARLFAFGQHQHHTIGILDSPGGNMGEEVSNNSNKRKRIGEEEEVPPAPQKCRLLYQRKEAAPRYLDGILKAPMTGVILQLRVDLEELIRYKNKTCRQEKESMNFIEIVSLVYVKEECNVHALRACLNLASVNGVLKFRPCDTMKRSCSIFRALCHKEEVSPNTPIEKLILITDVDSSTDTNNTTATNNTTTATTKLRKPMLLETALKKFAIRD